MHVLITGGRGQLGLVLADAFGGQGHADLTIWNRPEYDISDPSIRERLSDLRPNLVVNCAAWTDVDGAEKDPNAAYAVNALGPRYLAEGCLRCGAEMVQISTNEVFAGKPERFYREYDLPNPNSVYARSKFAGEVAAKEVLSQLYIVRTAWLFGIGDNNFPAKIVNAAKKQGSLRVVDDEMGNPTYAPDLADAVVALTQTGRHGTYHLMNDGYTSRYQWAKAVLDYANSTADVTPIPSSEWVRSAEPPLHAVLVNQAAAALGVQLRPWQDALIEYSKLMQRQQQALV